MKIRQWGYLLHNEIQVIVTFSNYGGTAEPGLSCTKETGGHSLEDWQKDDYALVRQITRQQFDGCLEQFQANQDQIIRNITRFNSRALNNVISDNKEESNNERTGTRS